MAESSFRLPSLLNVTDGSFPSEFSAGRAELLEEERRRNRFIAQLWLEERAKALALDRELRAMKAARSGRYNPPTGQA